MDFAELSEIALNITIEASDDPTKVVVNFHDNVEDRLGDFWGLANNKERILRFALFLSLAANLQATEQRDGPVILW